MLRDSGIRDEHGLEPIEGIFSSPEKPMPLSVRRKSNETTTSSEDMDVAHSKLTEMVAICDCNISVFPSRELWNLTNNALHNRFGTRATGSLDREKVDAREHSTAAADGKITNQDANRGNTTTAIIHGTVNISTTTTNYKQNHLAFDPRPIVGLFHE